MDRDALLWKVVGALSGAVAGMAARQLLEVSWRRMKGDDPPANPAAPGTQWSEAILWAAASGVGVAVARLVAQRGAAEAWRAKKGSYPRALETVTP